MGWRLQPYVPEAARWRLQPSEAAAYIPVCVPQAPISIRISGGAGGRPAGHPVRPPHLGGRPLGARLYHLWLGLDPNPNASPSPSPPQKPSTGRAPLPNQGRLGLDPNPNVNPRA
eukprot:scaffold60390_cov54-Phaeocystis_antarctica.AAC.2